MQDTRRIRMCDHRHRHSAARGLTLLEVMIALVILSIGLLALSGMQITSIKANGSGFKSTTAVSLADQGMQQLKNHSYSDAALTNGAHTDTSVTVNGIVFNPGYTVQADPVVPDVKLVTYTVTWNDGGAHSVSMATRINNEKLL
jgi:type IV pilus assembly protein PilV